MTILEPLLKVTITLSFLILMGYGVFKAIPERKRNFLLWLRYKLLKKKLSETFMEEIVKNIQEEKKMEEYAKQKILKGDIPEKKLKEFLYIYEMIEQEVKNGKNNNKWNFSK